jgi:endogenous inhibitor of DNA gyrase (YacG/DUF329 family)
VAERKAAKATGGKRTKCPICGKPAGTERWPFCSDACADKDLAKWLGGEYRIPTPEPAPVGDSEDEDLH